MHLLEAAQSSTQNALLTGISSVAAEPADKFWTHVFHLSDVQANFKDFASKEAATEFLASSLHTDYPELTISISNLRIKSSKQILDNRFGTWPYISAQLEVVGPLEDQVTCACSYGCADSMLGQLPISIKAEKVEAGKLRFESALGAPTIQLKQTRLPAELAKEYGVTAVVHIMRTNAAA